MIIQTKINDTYDIIMSDVFNIDDLCYLTCEFCYDCLYFNSSNYEQDSIVQSGFSENLALTLGHNEFLHHPIRKLIDEWLKSASLSYTRNNVNTILRVKYQELPGIHLCEIRHDEKRCTVFVEFSIYASIGQLQFLNRDCIKNWSICVMTPVGNFQI